MARLVIEVRDVWKVFGPKPREALAAARDGKLGKAALRERYHATIGVAGADFAVNAGEIFCVMGLSGCGKSTLVRLINRLIEPTAGEIRIDGTSVTGLGPAALRELRSRAIGMVFQHHGLIPHRSVRDNAALPLEIRGVPRHVREDRADAALARVGLAGWGDHAVQALSGGMQQRVGLARALAADPAVLLMDEPFSALDPLIRRDLQDEFLRLSREIGKTTVFITHDLDEAFRIGNRVAIMRDGAVVQIGTPEEITRAPANDYVATFVGRSVGPGPLDRDESTVRVAIERPLGNEATAASAPPRFVTSPNVLPVPS